jgi:Family of unknown function (DUF6228)
MLGASARNHPPDLAMMYAVSRQLVLQPQPNGPRWTLHQPVDPYGDGYIWHLGTQVDAEGLAAMSTATVGAPDAAGLVEYLEDLVENWAGWPDSRQWRSFDSELELDARHDQRRQVALGVTLRRPRRPYDADAWTVRVVLLVEAGEQLTQIARDVRALLAEGAAE